ncbi:Spc98 family-domain-containing protein [Podospora didyma]|uniref:Spindle pole body component n=1 Tax=Podospora didyma TaxID=330526 RepID=A0AAE0NZG7_9PEZI|nr:Spc98 family-domain-containing protein [Podospora didyma]
MAGVGDDSNLFAIPDFWQTSGWLNERLFDVSHEHPLFSFHISETPNVLVTGGSSLQDANVVADVGFFKLPPDLKQLALHEAKSETSPDFENPESESDIILAPGPPENDVWLGVDEGFVKPPEYKTWENFDRVHYGQSSPVFITEAGPAAFDALIASDQDSSSKPGINVVDDASYCACLLTLALGRNSLLFTWDSEKHTFHKTVSRLKTSGLSLESIECIDKLCISCANSMKHLQSFSDKIYSHPSTPAKVALAQAIEQLVLALQTELNDRRQSVRSILQLQSLVQPVQTVLSYFEDLVGKLAAEKSDEKMLSRLFQEAQYAEYRNSLLRDATREVLRLVSRPWINFVQEWIGFSAEDGVAVSKKGSGKGFVKVAGSMWIDDQGFELEEADYFLDDEKMPSFVPGDIAQAIFETGRNLRFLREHHPEHPFSRQNLIDGAKPPKLEWQFDWDAIKQLETNVNEYQNALSRAIKGHLQGNVSETELPTSWGSADPLYELKFFGKSEDEVAANVIASMEQFDQPLDTIDKRDGLTVLLRARLYQRTESPADHERLSPHWSLVPLLSFRPVVDAQSRLVNQECMKLLFSAHDLRVHIDVLKQFYLLGNGLLCSRLSHSLFDPDLESAERKSGVAIVGGSMGLRLGGRESWPPASSELRLALMGVLSDSYQPLPSHRGIAGGKPSVASRTWSSDLPADLSFAVRDLSPEDIERCMDPDSIEALDFLQLSYKPPSSLRSILTPVILLRYDLIFKLLLRVLRMLYVVNQLFRDVPASGRHGSNNASARFCIEARHFVRQIAAYFFDTGITARWRRFDEWLDVAERECLGANYNGTGDEGNGVKTYSPDTLRERQEHLLDEIMLVLLLRKRQLPVLRLLEETFSVILRFAKQVRIQAHGGARKDEKDETPEELYAKFRKQVEVFITVCKGLGEKQIGSSRQGRDGRQAESTVDQLLLMLDMSGFYEKKR